MIGYVLKFAYTGWYYRKGTLNFTTDDLQRAHKFKTLDRALDKKNQVSNAQVVRVILDESIQQWKELVS